MHRDLFLLTFGMGPFILSLSGTMGNVLFTFIPITIAALTLPARRKDGFNLSPGIVNNKVANIPLISLLGAISLLFVILNGYLFLVNSAYGANSSSSPGLVGGIILAGIMWFYIWKYYRKRQGIDVALAFRQIPPE